MLQNLFLNECANQIATQQTSERVFDERITAQMHTEWEKQGVEYNIPHQRKLMYLYRSLT